MEGCYFDLHTHMLPGVDDGAKSFSQALRMAEMAYSEGVRKVIFTPHYGLYNETYDAEKSRGVFQELKEALLSYCKDMNVYLGNEIYYGPETIQALHDGMAMTLAETDYVLVEFATDGEFITMQQAVQSLVMAGYRPVIAHAERYRCLWKHVCDVEELVYRGALIQINSCSLLSGAMDMSYRFVKRLLKENLVHFLGTDCHNDSDRKPEMRAAAEKLHKLAGEAQSEKILRGNGEKLLRNAPIE